MKQDYKKTKIGVIPKEWEVKKLGEIGEIYQPKTISQSELTKTGYYVYGANGIIGKYHQYNHELEQIAVTCRGNTCGMVNFTKPKSWITGNAMVINLDNSKNVDKKFMYYKLLNINLLYLVTGSGQPQITSDIKKHKLTLPPLKEQQKIAEILSTWDEMIEKQESLIKEKENLKKGISQQLLTGKVRFKEFSDEWKEMKLGEIGEIYQPKTISQSELTKNGYYVYGANGIIGKYHQYNHELEQIAVTCRGNSCGMVNFTKPKSWITGNAMVINLDNSKNVDKKFIYYKLLNTHLLYLVTGSGQPQITSDIKKHKLKLPPINEQQKIAEVLSTIDKEIELLKQELNELKNQKKGLSQKLLSGEVRVKV